MFVYITVQEDVLLPAHFLKHIHWHSLVVFRKVDPIVTFMLFHSPLLNGPFHLHACDLHAILVNWSVPALPSPASVVLFRALPLKHNFPPRFDVCHSVCGNRNLNIKNWAGSNYKCWYPVSQQNQFAVCIIYLWCVCSPDECNPIFTILNYVEPSVCT